MRRLVQRIEREPPSRALQRAFELADGDSCRDEPREDDPEAPAEILGDKALPVVEFRAASKREPGQEVVPVEVRSRGERAGIARRRQSVEFPQVAPGGGLVERDRSPGDDEGRPDCRAGHRQGTPQRRPGARLGGVGPEQAGEPIVALLSAGHGKQGQERSRFASVENRGTSAAFDYGRTEER